MKKEKATIITYKQIPLPCEETLSIHRDRDYCKARYEAAEAYIEALHELIVFPSETNRINVEVRKNEWLSYVELKPKEK